MAEDGTADDHGAVPPTAASAPEKRGRKRHLTDEQAAEAREMYSGPWLPRQIAHYFQVSVAVVHAAIDQKGAYAPRPSNETNDPLDGDTTIQRD